MLIREKRKNAKHKGYNRKDRADRWNTLLRAEVMHMLVKQIKLTHKFLFIHICLKKVLRPKVNT